MLLYQSLNLYTSPEAYTFEPVFVDASIPRESLVVRRTDGVVVLNAPPSPTLAQEQVTTIHGILGIIRLNAGDHIVVISGRKKIGTLAGHDIFLITAHKILSVSKSQTHLVERQVQDDATYISMLNDLLSSGSFYFSYTFDLTHSLQKQASLASASSLPLWQRADERFYWNRFLQTPLISITQKDPLQSSLSRFILPIMCGFVTIIQTKVHATAVTFSLISRRSQFRAGTRYHSRGINDQGQVSNFVETEQILELPGTGLMCSYRQTRGSIPLYWRQVINAKYQPKLVVENNPLTAVSFKAHFYEQFERYGNQIVVNLINKHGYESPLGTEFANRIGEMKDERLRFIHFDFHEHCKKMRWDRISVLIQAIEEDLAEQGYCSVTTTASSTPVLIKSQTSVVRTNCIDCLDRTNVVQSVLARRSLNRQMRDLNLLVLPTESLVDLADFEQIFKNAWADNADQVSKQYSGTGALKTDFTRTGKRSKSGVFQDLSNSIVRYIKNNFLDGFRQDSYDLFLGKYRVDASRPSPFSDQKITLHFILAAALAMFTSFCMLYMVLVAGSAITTGLVMVMALMSSGAVFYLVHFYGREFVANPMLVPDVWVAESEGTDQHKNSYAQPHNSSEFDIQMTEMFQSAKPMFSKHV